MLVRVRSWFERYSEERAGCFIMGVELFVTFARGGSASRPSRDDDTEGMFCNANIVADCGGVFSPSMLRVGLLAEARIAELIVDGAGVGVPGAVFSFSADLDSLSFSLLRTGVDGLGYLSFSGEPRGVELAESLSLDPSIIKLRSLTLPGWRDCIRLCGLLPLGTRARSGDVSAIRFARWGTSAFSRAFSVNAACADWIASDVPLRDGLTPGD